MIVPVVVSIAVCVAPCVRLKYTLLSAVASVAVVLKITVPDLFWPFVGALMVTLGAVLSTLKTTTSELLILPSVSFATTVIIVAPSGIVVVSKLAK